MNIIPFKKRKISSTPPFLGDAFLQIIFFEFRVFFFFFGGEKNIHSPWRIILRHPFSQKNPVPFCMICVLHGSQISLSFKKIKRMLMAVLYLSVASLKEKVNDEKLSLKWMVSYSTWVASCRVVFQNCGHPKRTIGCLPNSPKCTVYTMMITDHFIWEYPLQYVRLGQHYLG